MRQDLAREVDVREDRIQVRQLFFFLSYYYSQNEKFTSERSSTLVLAHLPLTRFVRRNNYPGLLPVLLVKFVEKNVCSFSIAIFCNS